MSWCVKGRFPRPLLHPAAVTVSAVQSAGSLTTQQSPKTTNFLHKPHRDVRQDHRHFQLRCERSTQFRENRTATDRQRLSEDETPHRLQPERDNNRRRLQGERFLYRSTSADSFRQSCGYRQLYFKFDHCNSAIVVRRCHVT